MASTGETWRLGRRPALDGLRGIAVLLVVLFHTNLAMWAHGAGAAGVSVFFVLSGFLITAQLVEQHERGGVRLGRFARRRARRLVPALAVFLAVMVPVSLLLPGLVPGRCIPWAASYAANVPMMKTADVCGALTHTWSLAVEVHFYVLFGLAAVVALRFRGRRALVCVIAVGLVASLAARVWFAGDYLHVYYGSDTNMYALLAGALLASALTRSSGASLPAAWPLGLAALALLCLPSRSVIAPVAVVAVTAVLVHAVARDAAPRWLSARWLVLVGQRSYGLYLWHVPIVYFSYALTRHGAPMVPTMLVSVGVAWVVTLASWRYVERPVSVLRLGEESHAVQIGEIAADRDRYRSGRFEVHDGEYRAAG